MVRGRQQTKLYEEIELKGKGIWKLEGNRERISSKREKILAKFRVNQD